MSKKISLGAAIALILLCCLATFQVTYLTTKTTLEKRYRGDALTAYQTSSSGIQSGQSQSGADAGNTASGEFMTKVYRKLSEVDSLFRSYYLDEIDDDYLTDCIVDGYVAGTKDAYGAYYNAAEFENFISDMDGEVVGIGVNVIYNTDYGCIEVLNVMPDSPALEAGVLPGDLIWTVGDEKELVSELGYYPAIAKLRGEIGTIAIFSVRRGEKYEESVDFRIARARVTEITVMSHVYGLDNTIGVVRITGFDATTPTQFVQAVESLRAEGCTKLIVDLRYNPGGELNSIVKTLDYILPEGPIVRIIDKDGNEVNSYSSEPTELDMPMAVLVNGSTASAAELFTSAVRDYQKAVIVGTTTYGKGCMQTTIPLETGGAVSITYRMYNPPFSENYHGVGIIPDVEVELDEALSGKNTYKITDEEDNQLAAAAAQLSPGLQFEPGLQIAPGTDENETDTLSAAEVTFGGSGEFMTRLNTKLAEVDSIFRSYYLEEIDDDTLIDSILDGYVAGTKDAYGAYYNEKEFEDFISDMDGEVVGIGVSVIYNTEYECIEVLNVIPDSPALEAGVQPGDLIWTVGDEKELVSELGYYPAIAKLRGEVGTTAVFSVRRGEKYAESTDFRIVRAKVTEITVMNHVYGPDNTIGVIRITGFDATTPTQFVQAVESLRAEGCSKLVIDLRYNPGGELGSIVTTLDYILPEGPIIRIIDKDGNEVSRYDSEATELDMPMAVLVNGSTASAAELFTSAVRDYQKAVIVGTTTYGKGCMQTTIPLSSGGAVSVTYRMYNPPFSDNYHGVGIVPDVEVELDESLAGKNTYKITDEEDNQLAAAAAVFGN